MKEDQAHALTETLMHRENKIQELELEGKIVDQICCYYTFSSLPFPSLPNLYFIFFSGRLKLKEIEVKAKDYGILDVVNCGVG